MDYQEDFYPDAIPLSPRDPRWDPGVIPVSPPERAPRREREGDEGMLPDAQRQRIRASYGPIAGMDPSYKQYAKGMIEKKQRRSAMREQSVGSVGAKLAQLLRQ